MKKEEGGLIKREANEFTFEQLILRYNPNENCKRCNGKGHRGKNIDGSYYICDCVERALGGTGDEYVDRKVSVTYIVDVVKEEK